MIRGRRRDLLKASLAAAGMAAGDRLASGRQADDLTRLPPGPPFLINHDLHTHTTYSDGAHPVPLHILEARAFELQAVAITDHHYAGMKIHDSDDEFERYLAEIDKERSGQSDVLVLKGAEATALDATGRISIDERRASRLEWVLCDLSAKSEGTLKSTPPDKTKYIDNVLSTYLGMCDLAYLDVIAHPFNTGNTVPAALPEDYPERRLRELAAKMADKGKVFDVMNDMIYWFSKSGVAPRTVTAQYIDLVKIFAAEKVRFQVSSDDHRTGLGNTRWSQIVLARAGVPASQIVDPRKIRRVGG